MTVLYIQLFATGTDVSTTMIVEPGPVIDFILSNQYIKDPRRIDWGKVSHGLDATHVFPQ